MTALQRRFWEVVRVVPAKWRQHPYGDCCGGFWVVAIIGQCVVWYNEIEEGFNLLRYSQHGLIDEYWCNQDQLEWTLESVLKAVSEGAPFPPGGTGPPEFL